MINSTNKFYLENNIENSIESLNKSYDEIDKNINFMNKTIEVFKEYFTLKKAVDESLMICKGTLNNCNIVLNENIEKKKIMNLN